MPEITLFLYVLVTFFTLWLGVRVYGRWINHITIYGLVWGTEIILYQLRLINYYDLSLETTVFVFGAWTVFVLASLTFKDFYSLEACSAKAPAETNENRLLFVFVGLTFLGALGVIQEWMALVKMFGSVSGVVLNGNLIYSLTRSGFDVPGAWDYVNSLNLAADFMGGYYAGHSRRWALLGIIPFVFEVAYGISAFGRSRLIIGTILWGCAFFLPKFRKHAIERRVLLRRVLLFGSIILIFVFGMEFVRTFRGARESFTGETAELSQLKGVGFITPSIYLYLSSDLPVLNKYIGYDYEGKGEHTPAGYYSMAPIYRFFTKFEIVDPGPKYQKFYSMPTLSNTGSYLKDLYVDWGIVGTMFIVYLLAITCSLVFESYRRKKSIVLLAVLCHLYVLVFFTFALQATVWTYWLISLAGSVLGAVIIENSGRGKDEKTMWTIA